MLISVIIPTYHRNDLLAKCLGGLAPGKQLGGQVGRASLDSSDFEYEVIVTDDGSKTSAQDLISADFPWATWVPGPQKGPASNRNNGAIKSRGEWIAFTDDDCLPQSNWLRAIWATASDGKVDVIEGKTVTPDKVDNPFKQGVENVTGGNYWSCNLAVRREAFFEIGAFDEDFLEAGGEDLELAYRIRVNRLRSEFVEEALILHPVRRLGLKQLFWRTFLIRWTLLYHLKIGNAAPRDASGLLIACNLFKTRFLDLARTSFHLFSKPDTSAWRTRLFFAVWNWFTFPVTFPYLVMWEFRFRKLLNERTREAGDGRQ